MRSWFYTHANQELEAELLRLKSLVMGSIAMWRLAVALSCICGAQVAQPAAPVSAKPARVELSGTVVNAASGEPIRRALVQAGDLAMLTDAQGRFHFEVLAGMAVSARASKP